MGNSARIFGSMDSKLAGVGTLGSLGPGRKALSAVMWTLVSNLSVLHPRFPSQLEVPIYFKLSD
jgi:hypothetical protein